MNISCLIVDDEPLAVRLISSYIKQLSGLKITATCNSAIDAFKILREQRIDLIFIDIKMPKLSGIDFLRSLANPPKIIFITAYRDYAMEGYDLDVVDYLLKPVSLPRFMKAVDKATKMISIDNNQAPSISDQKEDNLSFLYFRVDKEMLKVMLHEIQYIESVKGYVKIFLANGKSLLVKQSITSVEKMISHNRFIRIHRSFVAAIDKITSFTSTHISIGRQKLPIGRLYKNEVEDVLK